MVDFQFAYCLMNYQQAFELSPATRDLHSIYYVDLQLSTLFSHKVTDNGYEAALDVY